MRGKLIRVSFTACAALVLTACGLADSHSFMPGFMRVKESVPPPEATPDVKRMVRENLNSVFVSTSYPRAVQVSPPVHDLRGRGWNACVRAEFTNAVGKPLGSETYRISITDGVIFDRRRIEADDTCANESYEPIE
jgi:hypothetical protein